MQRSFATNRADSLVAWHCPKPHTNKGVLRGKLPTGAKNRKHITDNGERK